jgi:hypothetical protein
MERITEVDLDTMGSDRAVRASNWCAPRWMACQSDEGTVSFSSCSRRHDVAIIAETLEVVEQGRGYFERVTDSRGIFGPPAVLASNWRARSRSRRSTSSRRARRGGRSDLAADPALFRRSAKDTKQRLAELAALTRAGARVVACQNEGERRDSES